MSLMADVRRWSWPVLASLALMALVTGSVLLWRGDNEFARLIWYGGAFVVFAALCAEILHSLLNRHFGVDIIAGLSISAALAFGEPLAAIIVALMYSGGQLLETYAEGRARREMTALLGRVARTALRYDGDRLEEVSIEALAPGERILVRRGEVVPVDGRLSGDRADIDMSALTGEPMPVRFRADEEIPSGGVSVGAAFDLAVLRPAADSTYANIVRLVEGAQQSRAPIMRLADRYALWFLVATLLIAGGAWIMSGDRLRALAVLVVATPCPLILAVPVAIISGMSRVASMGVLVKSGGALETMARVRIAILDKTGTMTSGEAGIVGVRTRRGTDPEEMIRLAASLDQASGHPSAEILVASARERGLLLSSPIQVEETPGSGLCGLVDGQRVVVGGSEFVRTNSEEGDPYELGRDLPPGSAVVAVAIDGRVAGILLLSDRLRPEAHAVVDAFRKAGIRRLVLASGDRADVVQAVGTALGLDGIHGELTPAGKVDIVLEARREAPVIMVGDGVNDAPALAAADIGVAVGVRGSAASSEAADAVLLVDDLGRIASALAAAGRTRRIALQSVTAGIGLSLLAMMVAAFGYLPPVQGALLQEFIDMAVILNALRALRGGATEVCR